MEIAGYLAFEWVCGAMHLKFHHLILDWGVKGFTRKKQIRISQYTGLWGFMQKAASFPDHMVCRRGLVWERGYGNITWLGNVGSYSRLTPRWS